MSSDIVSNDVVHWATFHSGYDFGHLLKLFTCRNLPDTQTGFSDLINMCFPMVYDIKHTMKFCNNLHGGLSKLAKLLEVERVGFAALNLVVHEKKARKAYTGSECIM
ncbi:hypothetical protein V6N13_051611 [Hibiscus sabdariffa]